MFKNFDTSNLIIFAFQFCLMTFIMREEIHIGHIIEKKVKENGISVVDFAARLNCNRTNVYNIYRRASIDTDLLQRISKVLNYDFFQIYSTK